MVRTFADADTSLVNVQRRSMKNITYRRGADNFFCDGKKIGQKMKYAGRKKGRLYIRRRSKKYQKKEQG